MPFQIGLMKHNVFTPINILRSNVNYKKEENLFYFFFIPIPTTVSKTPSSEIPFFRYRF